MMGLARPEELGLLKSVPAGFLWNGWAVFYIAHNIVVQSTSRYADM